MFERILVPVDFSEQNQLSIEHAARLASPGALVTLMHVIEEIEHLDDQEDKAFYDKLIQMAEEKMAALEEFARNLGLEIVSEVMIGKRAAEILTVAKERNFSIIVLHTHTANWEEPMESLGGTSHVVAVYAHCPVFLVR